MPIIRPLILLLLCAYGVFGATAGYVGKDTTTNGNWFGVYGADGWFINGDVPQASYPAYITTPTFASWGGGAFGATTDVRALQLATNHSSRSASLLYVGGTATVDFTVTGTHKLTMYVWAADSATAESVQILDMDNGGVALDTQSIPDTFTTGTYLSWGVSGHIRISITAVSGANGGRLSGLFFDVMNPMVGTLSPNVTLPGNSTTLAVTGINTHFVNGTTTVGVSGTGVTVGSVTVNSPLSLTAPITVASGATTGTRTVTVATGAETETVTLYLGAANWRVNTTMSSTWSIAELRFYDSNSTEIDRTGGTASSTPTGSTPANAFDNNATTFWVGAQGSAIAYRFPSVVTPAYFTLQSRSDAGSQVPTDFTFQYSGDGTNWVTQWYYYGVNWTTTLGGVMTFNGSNAAPPIGVTWRLLVTADSGTQSVSIIELQFQNSDSSVIPTPNYAALTSSTLVESYPDSGMIAFDGVTTGAYWASTGAPSSGSPQWIAYRFASAGVYPAKFTIYPRQITQAPSAFSIQYSTNEISWTTVQTYTSSWPNINPQTFIIPQTTNPGGMMILSDNKPIYHIR